MNATQQSSIVINQDLLQAQTWDVVIVGAGPAGCMSALELSRRGRSVLLVEAKLFPRDKVCGGCLNRRAWKVLHGAGMDQRLIDAGATPLVELNIVCGERKALWSMPTMHALSRRALDWHLAQAAAEAGTLVLMETQARIEPIAATDTAVTIQLKRRSSSGEMFDATVTAKIAIAADGLTHSSLAAIGEVSSEVAAGSRVGLGTTLEHGDDYYAPGRLTMVVGQAGYVGLTCVEQGRLNIAAALSIESLRAGHCPGAVIADLLRRSHVRAPLDCETAQWTGTPALTRQSRQWSAPRLFLVGDAAGYVEPFTGEGMSWALAGAVEVAKLADQAVDRWSDDLAHQWQAAWRAHVRRHQTACRGLAWLLKKPRLAEFTLSAVQHMPWIAQSIMHRVAG